MEMATADTLPPAAVTKPPSWTVAVTVAERPAAVAVTLAAPTATPSTRPDDETVTFAASELLQAADTSWPVSAVATSCTVWPGTSSVADGEIVSDPGSVSDPHAQTSSIHAAACLKAPDMFFAPVKK